MLWLWNLQFISNKIVVTFIGICYTKMFENFSKPHNHLVQYNCDPKETFILHFLKLDYLYENLVNMPHCYNLNAVFYSTSIIGDNI